MNPWEISRGIEALVDGPGEGKKEQVLLGVTGLGKTFTMANIIANVNKPTLVLARNKTLAAQLCSEFREFFPENAVEYFVSYHSKYPKMRDLRAFFRGFLTQDNIGQHHINQISL